jgi:hypothetical protein
MTQSKEPDNSDFFSRGHKVNHNVGDVRITMGIGDHVDWGPRGYVGRVSVLAGDRAVLTSVWRSAPVSELAHSEDRAQNCPFRPRRKDTVK